MNKSRVALFFVLLVFAGCELVGDIFKAGVWTGVIIVVAVIAGIIFLVKKMAGK